MRTPLYDIYHQYGATIVDFHGWELPLSFQGIIAEHTAVRTSCGIFDVSHMGELVVKGNDAYEFVQTMITNDLGKLTPGRALYTPLCYEHGGIVDDVIVYCLDSDEYLIVCNAANIEKDFQWFLRNKKSFTASVENQSSAYAQIAVQGPKAIEITEKVVGYSLSDLRPFSFIKIGDTLISRTGYTGEDGCEIFLPPSRAPSLFTTIVSESKGACVPCGLGARDTLRTEAGYMLYGNDIDETTTPLEAPLSWTVTFAKETFVGKHALTEQLSRGVRKKLVGFTVQSNTIVRPKTRLYADEKGTEEVGYVTSGIFSPTFRTPLGMAYVKTQFSSNHTLYAPVRGSMEALAIRDTRFYRRK